MKLLLLAEHVELLVELVVEVGLPLAEVAQHGKKVDLGLLVGEVTGRAVEAEIQYEMLNNAQAI
jgi:hypothetical protein